MEASHMPDFAMGSLVSSLLRKPNGGRATDPMSQPRTLDELLRAFDGRHFKTAAEVDAAIEAGLWPKKFRDYLRKRNLEDEENMLRFLVMTQSIQAGVAKLATPEGKKDAKKAAKIRSEMAETFAGAGTEFFSEEGENQLCLANSKLFEILCQLAVEVMETKHKRGLSDEDASMVIKARTDLNVRANGLDPKFDRFTTSTSASPIACLLSIL